MNQKQSDNNIGGRYQILKSIGRGEFGEVWLAVDQRNNVNIVFI